MKPLNMTDADANTVSSDEALYSVPVLLSVQGLNHRYGQRQALNQINLKLYQGRFNALLGANGAGKSTLFNLLAGLIRRQEGELVFNGEPLDKATPDYLCNLGIVFQQSTLDLDLTVGQNLHYHASLQGMSRKEAKARIHQELERLELLDRLNTPVRQLNGGHKRRVEIARALLHNPAFLMLDEATAGLDIQTRRQLTEYLHQRCEEGLTVLWTTHLLEEIADEDPVTILHQGEVVCAGLQKALLEQSPDASLAGLLNGRAGICKEAGSETSKTPSQNPEPAL